MAGKSLEDEVEKYRNTFRYDKEFQLSIDAWKILTDNQTFDEEISISSKKLFKQIFLFLMKMFQESNAY